MQLKIVPIGKEKNPATVTGIGLKAGKEIVEGVTVLEAYNDHGNRRVVAEIICGYPHPIGIGEEDAGREQAQRDIRSGVQ